ncbi:alpha/beta hydrolase [Variovorax sp. CCNWLW186]|uniref:alpha/beta fold hydrolase n=1 Tax=Variovorax sp. CCNWLW186 TaxID=3127473 RepID=UPI00307855C7
MDGILAARPQTGGPTSKEPLTMVNPEIKSYRVPTSHGAIAVDEVGKGKTQVVFVHGNSSCGRIFRHQMLGPLSRSCRLLALDLPGHGASDDAIDPYRTYTRPGFADAIIEALRVLSISEPIVFGWSLGGHIAIEMAARFQGIRGLMISGTPPVGRNDAALGFRTSGHGALGRKRNLSSTEIVDFARGMAGDRVDDFLREAIARCDGRAREILFQARDAGAGVDQRKLVESNPMPLAVVNGEDDPFIHLDFLDGISYANLWEARCHRLPGVGHAPFWGAPALFNPILERFVREIA